MGYFIIVAIVILNIYICYMRVIKKENIVFIGNYACAVILSGSMEPNLSVNDLVIIKKQPDYYIDDIIVYSNNDALVVHRIVNENNNNVVTMGDANTAIDNPINKKSIKGKVIHRYPKIGKYISILNNPILILSIIFSYIVIDILLKKHVRS